MRPEQTTENYFSPHITGIGIGIGSHLDRIDRIYLEPCAIPVGATVLLKF